MKIVTRIALSVSIGIVLAITPAWSQEDMTVVDNTAFDNPQRTPSVFVHDEHNETAGIDDCAACHHVYADGQLVEDESSEDQSCSECHSLEGADGSAVADQGLPHQLQGLPPGAGKGADIMRRVPQKIMVNRRLHPDVHICVLDFLKSST
jgi:cytochrome c553